MRRTPNSSCQGGAGGSGTRLCSSSQPLNEAVEPVPSYSGTRHLQHILRICGSVVTLRPLVAESFSFSFLYFHIFSPRKTGKKQGKFPYFGNLTDGKMSGKLNFHNLEKLKPGKPGNTINCAKTNHGKHKRMKFRTKKNFDNNGP